MRQMESGFVQGRDLVNEGTRDFRQQVHEHLEGEMVSLQ